MYKILLDDNFYRNTLEQNRYLDKLLQTIKDYFDAKIIIFEPFYKKNISYHLPSMSQNINRKILETEKMEKYDLNDVVDASDSFLENMSFTQSFIGKIKYIIDIYPNDILIIPLIYSIKNRELVVKGLDDCIFFIGNYDEEVKSNIADWICKNELIHIPKSSFDNKFPAKDLCNGYNEWRSEILQSSYSGQKISDFTQIGIEVAIRNHYIYDAKLTALNKRRAKKDKKERSPKRQVFINQARDVYLSTDFLHGGFEVYDKNAVHQGQYKFNGNFEKAPDNNSHPLFLK